jgi:diguanylate cyclase (GGDEF)-like protein/PAS domain S-box-containing protein
MTSSIRARFLLTAALLAVLALPAIYFTEQHVRQISRDSTDLVQEHRDLGWVLDSLKDALQVTENAIYQHPLLLDEHSTRQVLVRLAEVKLQAKQLLKHYVVRKHQNFEDFALNFQVVIDQLDKQTHHLLAVLSKVDTRFPAAPILMEEMKPNNEVFTGALEQALGEAAESPGDHDQEQVAKLLRELRYVWGQQVSTVRVFIANRSGVFGEPAVSMDRNRSDRKIYSERVDELLDELTEYRKVDKLGFLQSTLIDVMREAKRQYDKSFERAAEIYTSRDWRADLPLLRNEIRPVLDQAWGIIELMQEELDDLAQKNVLKTLDATDTLTRVIWLFAGFMALLVMTGYAVFEFAIRRPILEVTKALEAQGRGEDYLPELRPRTQETAVLVNAFVRMQGQVQTRQERLESILDNAAEGIITIDEFGVVETFNNAAQQLFGYSAEEALGKSVMSLVPFPNDGSYNNFLELCQSAAREGGRHETTVSTVRRDGASFPMAIKVNQLETEGRRLYIAIVEDIGERMAMMQHLREMAEHDSLTGLYNRQYFLNELDRVVENAKRGSRRDFALLYIDLDNFKFVNDTLGHLAGDQVLIEVTEMLSQRIRKSDLLARLGGDEFAILLYDVREDHVIQAAEAHRKLLADYAFKYDGKVINVGCTIGMTMFGHEVTSREDLLVQADVACHIAKRSGRNCIHMYEPDDQQNMTTMSEDMGWARRIKDAIEQGHFRLSSQPIMDLKTGNSHHREVLLRMQDEDGHIILPAGFLPSAERFGLMRGIDRWVVNHAVENLARQLKSNPHTHYSINLSAESIGDATMLETITAVLQRHDVPPTAVTFEITETVAIAHLGTAVEFLSRLRNLGCQTALDDFGVGYSSFAYLKDLPVDYVKIDGSFVRDIPRDTLQHAMVRSMNDIAHAMGKQTIAEFVDSEECLGLLRKIGVDYVQGYYVGKPQLMGEEAVRTSKSSTVVRLV